MPGRPARLVRAGSATCLEPHMHGHAEQLLGVTELAWWRTTRGRSITPPLPSKTNPEKTYRAQECDDPVSPSYVRDDDLRFDSYSLRTAVPVL
jgi:hypothetical protein